MPHSVEIRTGARLHFGPLSYLPTSGRHFGGIGMMIAAPGYAVRGTFELRGLMVDSGAPEELRFLSRWRERNPASPLPPVRLETLSQLPAHRGLGSGTQRALAISEALFRLTGRTGMEPEELALTAGRGLRSAIGIHGYFQGGFLVDAGHPQGNQAHPLGDLAARIPFPEPWRILLAFPSDVPEGHSGEQEVSQFEQLGPMPESTSGRLSRLVLTEMLPALQTQDLRAFNASLGEYGRLVGEFFTPVQGAVFRSPALQRLAEKLERETEYRLAQSSWGPTAAIVCEGDAEAAALRERLQQDCPQDMTWQITCPLNSGRTVVET